MTTADRAARRLFTLVSLAVCCAAGATAQPAANRAAAQPAASRAAAKPAASAAAAFDHSAFTALLGQIVASDGNVRYERLRERRAALDAYAASLAQADYERLPREAQLALLINAYNAFTLQLIVERYPLQSIMDIPAERRWDDRRWKLPMGVFSLNQIENELIRPRFTEPRIHFAVNCASIGCPPLAAEAYTGDRLDEQLAAAARRVHADPRWLRVDRKAGVVHLTKLYEWYGADFGADEGQRLAFAARYNAELKAALDAGEKLEIRWIEYDWALNAAR